MIGIALSRTLPPRELTLLTRSAHPTFHDVSGRFPDPAAVGATLHGRPAWPVYRTQSENYAELLICPYHYDRIRPPRISRNLGANVSSIGVRKPAQWPSNGAAILITGDLLQAGSARKATALDHVMAA
ncbi:hypothetical protein [Accumulibacter sp.]|uniref:hypothetical protein n=1 Tax=Accumulibacter sp. TaxID=2053492 RepID=UPI001AC64105|nr:hypothetical protein [Accumulibacter sp.]MBN8514303.1 hypothetical protein [Accumulibacter sp.]MBO3701975.1 hypothetical protein [Accumulibacter sp.]